MALPLDPRLVLSPAENARLIRCNRGRVLALAFGPRGVWPQTDSASGAAVSAWAPLLLAQWRGETFEAGGGI